MNSQGVRRHGWPGNGPVTDKKGIAGHGRRTRLIWMLAGREIAGVRPACASPRVTKFLRLSAPAAGFRGLGLQIRGGLPTQLWHLAQLWHAPVARGAGAARLTR